MSLYALKPRFQELLRPLARRLYAIGISANQVTFAACAISVALGAWLAVSPAAWPFLLVPAWLALRMAFNAIDGMLAREFGQASRLGAYLNELCDVISDAALYAPFALLPGSSPWLVGAVILLSALAEMAGVLGAALGGQRRYDGPLGKSDRALVFGVLGLLAGLGLWPGAPAWIWLTLLALLGLTVANRIRRGAAQ
ncbi:MAG: CDP-alcohol phosphatidyltransferase family protein [Burkholderiales bacterium]